MNGVADLWENWNADCLVSRASSTSVVIARSSDSRMERLNLYSSNARTPVALHGPSFSEDNIRRVSLRYGTFWDLNIGGGIDGLDANTSATNRKLPRSDPAAQSSPNVPSLVLLST